MTEAADLVRRAYEALNRRDEAGMIAVLDPAIELNTTVESYRGHDGVLTWLRDADRTFDGFHLEVEDVRERGDVAVAIVLERASGATTGLEVEHRFGHIWKARNGRLTHLDAYREPDEALRAAGFEN